DQPSSCVTDSEQLPASHNNAWTDLTYLLHKHKVSWKYYIHEGTQPDCDDGEITCNAKPQQVGTPSMWNPLPRFTTVRQNGELGNIQGVDKFYTDAKNGTLPAVSWIIPNQEVSEHPPALVSVGQNYVTGLVNAIMKGPNWNSSAIFIAWDDWGGFYDHKVPPTVDAQGYGLRVPGLVISPYAKRGFIDHQILSFDAYAKFIEDVFLKGERLDPKTDGRPDPRPTVRENAPHLGDLRRDFDFSQPPRPPLILPSVATKGS
ncbi:MAG TPA: alkaline phosphatase family protein, partial [Allocoleopsis sp.]